MQIKELKKGMSEVEVKGKVKSISEPRAVRTKYGPNTVADVTIEDETGTIQLTLWGEQISSVKEGDTVEIRGAYVGEWNNVLQLNVPKSGEMKVL